MNGVLSPSPQTLTLLQHAIALHQSGRTSEAEAAYRKILEDTPGHPDATALLGVARAQSGAASEGIELLREALRARPGDADFLTNLGLALQSVGNLTEAEQTLAEAVGHAPESTEAWLRLGNVRHQLDDLDAAETAYRAVLDREPNQGHARAGLGAVLRDRGDALGALDLLWSHVQEDPDDLSRWSAFVSDFRRVGFHGPKAVEQVMPVLLACLLHEGLDPQRLAVPALRLIHGHPEIAWLLELAGTDPTALDEALDDPWTWQMLANPAVLLLLQRVLAPDRAWEALFTGVRRYLAELVHRSDAADHPVAVDPTVAFSVARQCFHNGYVWSHDPEEQSLVESMVASMGDAALGSDSLDALRVAVLASYVPLIEWERAPDVVEWAESADSPSLWSLVTQQIFEPVEEDALRELIPSFGEAQTDVSVRVQEMYEEHPYPRWIALDPLEPAPAGEVLRRLFPSLDRRGGPNFASPQILVAGCGTGRHLLNVARRFLGAHVLGVDLSRSSLAYACRKANDAGITNVAMAQADILALATHPETYDIIECGGVLHHMEDPMAGWRTLTRILRPGGFMKIALYSEIGRRDVVEAQGLIRERGFQANPDEIRSARSVLDQALGDRSRAVLLGRRDFYSLPECRDMLFHVQEHRFTIPRIAESIEELGLDFVGFEHESADVTRRFRRRFPDPGAEQSLDAWRVYEEENPDTFSGMYQFWLRKPA